MNEPTRQAAIEAFKREFHITFISTEVGVRNYIRTFLHLDEKILDQWLACAEWMEQYATQAAYERAAQKLRAYAKNQTYTAPSSPYEHAANLIEDMARALANESSGKGEK